MSTNGIVIFYLKPTRVLRSRTKPSCSESCFKPAMTYPPSALQDPGNGKLQGWLVAWMTFSLTRPINPPVHRFKTHLDDLRSPMLTIRAEHYFSCPTALCCVTSVSSGYGPWSLVSKMGGHQVIYPKSPARLCFIQHVGYIPSPCSYVWSLTDHHSPYISTYSGPLKSTATDPLFATYTKHLLLSGRFSQNNAP